MMTHSVVYIVLSLLSLVAVHAMSAPMNGPRHEHHETERDADAGEQEGKSTDAF